MPSSLAYPHIMSEWTLLQPLSFDCFFLGSECVLLQYPSTLGPPVAQDPFSICFHQFNFHEERSIFTLFPHLPLATKLLSTVTPKVLVLILLNYSGPLTLWVSPPSSGHSITCFWSLSLFLPEQLHKAHSSTLSSFCTLPSLTIYPWSFLHSAWLPDLSLPPRPLLSFTPSFLPVWQAGSPTLFITPCPEPTLLTFHPGMPSHVFSVIVNLFISPDKSSWESMVFFPSNWLLFLNFVYNPA